MVDSPKLTSYAMKPGRGWTADWTGCPSTFGGQQGRHDWIDPPLADFAVREAIALDARILHGSAVTNSARLDDHFHHHHPVELPDVQRIGARGPQPLREDLLDVLQDGVRTFHFRVVADLENRVFR